MNHSYSFHSLKTIKPPALGVPLLFEKKRKKKKKQEKKEEKDEEGKILKWERRKKESKESPQNIFQVEL